MKLARILAAVVLVLAVLAGCSSASRPAAVTEAPPVTLKIVTTYGGDDGNRRNFENAVSQFMERTGVRVQDGSDTSSENWKARVLADFETNSEPDVLFYFVGADAAPLIRAGKVVPIREIQAQYPDYAANMGPAKLPVAADGENYAVPISGYWEYLFVNRDVLKQCGVALPGPGYTWEQFLLDCAAIRDAGFVPIACSLAEAPHYWFEYVLMNNGSADNHWEIPTLDEDGRLRDNAAARKWIAGLNDLRSLYEQQFFPANTLTAGDAEAVAMFGDGRAAFLLEGAWKVGLLTKAYGSKLDSFIVCPVPCKGARSSDTAIGEISTGFFLTRKAWENPEKREAAVEFISYLTSGEVIQNFVTTEITALREDVSPIALNSLQQSAAKVRNATTRWVGAVQDRITGEARASLFSNIPHIVTGRIDAREAVETAVQFNWTQNAK